MYMRGFVAKALRLGKLCSKLSALHPRRFSMDRLHPIG
jgi:hypothetical protein